MVGHFKFRLWLFGAQAKGNDYKEKTYCVYIWQAMDNVFGALGYFFKLNENGWVK